ncbi:hypothetical protein [Streptococcus marmotae]|uniref:hypothetical protein n=1 Tax=Streptococcus marmotae TaxID=1825069 RepID=UPI0008319AFD|nr:hypothetical protein [Streptococcus marmotae]QBX16894.1 hypothetical protein Javan291_0018 [Streptococcus phage Javan291]
MEHLKDLTAEEANVLNFIIAHGTCENPIPAKKAWKALGLYKRKLENIVECLKRKGHPVGSLKGKKHGLYAARNREELEMGLRANVTQARTTLQIAKVQRGIDFEEYWTRRS